MRYLLVIKFYFELQLLPLLEFLLVLVALELTTRYIDLLTLNIGPSQVSMTNNNIALRLTAGTKVHLW